MGEPLVYEKPEKRLTVVLVNASNVDQIWPTIAPLLQKAIDRSGDDLSTGDLWALARQGQAFLVIAGTDAEIVMASVWRFERWHEGQVFKCLALGGHRIGDWIEEFNDKILSMMREGGANRLVFEGRKGWPHMFAKVGHRVRELRSTYLMEI